MKTLIFVSTLILSMARFAAPGAGHSHGHGHGHGHGAPQISKEKIRGIGRSHIKRLIKLGKLDASWKSAIFYKSEKKKFKAKTEWVVTFNNEKGVKVAKEFKESKESKESKEAKGADDKKLYIFLKLSGEFVAANFTGK